MSRPPRIAVLDFGMGNRRSVQKALEHVGAQVQITSDAEQLERADGLILPGVGAFPAAMGNLRALGLDVSLRAAVQRGTPLLGVCLGMQLLFDRSDELSPTDGLGLISGVVTPLQSASLTLPHIGWNEVRFHRPSPLTAGLPAQGCAFYHVHSLAVRPHRDADLVASTTYGETFATIVQRDAVFGVQFHPEKSSVDGLRMLANFVGLCRRQTASRASTALRANREAA